MGYPVQFPSTWVPVVVRIADVSTADSEYISPGFRGKIKKVTSVLKNAITGTNSAVTVEISGTAVTGAALTITQSGSAAGDIDEATPSALNSFTEAQYIRVVTDGASTTTAPLTVTLWLEPT
jgi:hypothetical protein